MIHSQTADYTIRAKTGMTAVVDDRRLGWFVGYLERNGSTTFFATNIQCTGAQDWREFAQARVELTMGALKTLGRLPEEG